jgi:cysteine synthase
VMPAHTTTAKQALIQQAGGECYLVTAPHTITGEAERLAARHNGHYIGQFPNAATTPDWHGANSLTAIADRQLRRLRHPVPVSTVVPAGTGRTLTLFALRARANHRATAICVADFAESALCRAWMTRDRSATGEASMIEGDGRQQVEPGFDFGLIDDVVGVTDGESLAMMRFLEELTGDRFGGTTGRVVRGALAKLLEMRAGGEQGSVLAVGGDEGHRYDASLYSDQWVAEQGSDLPGAAGRLRHLIAYFDVGELSAP